jgi:hypothetical protein
MPSYPKLPLCAWCRKPFSKEIQLHQRGSGEYCSLGCRVTGGKTKRPHGVGHSYQRKDGYIAVKVKPGKQYELEHRVMMSLLLGRPLERQEEVHHKDEDRAHNCPGNLEMKPNGEHQRFHNALHPQSTKIPVSCDLLGCDEVILRTPYRLKTYKNIYCSNEHRLEAMHQKAREYFARQRSDVGG